MSLRKLNEYDLLPILDWRNSPEVRSHMYSTHIISEAEHLSWFKRMKQDPHSLWYIYENELGKPHGVVYFTQYLIENRNSFWGFYAAPEAPKGTGTKIGLEALDEAFNVLKLHKVNAEVLATNYRSLRFHEKLGFIKEGIFRDFHFNGSNFVDVMRFGILNSEWTISRPKLIKLMAGYGSKNE